MAKCESIEQCVPCELPEWQYNYHLMVKEGLLTCMEALKLMIQDKAGAFIDIELSDPRSQERFIVNTTISWRI